MKMFLEPNMFWTNSIASLCQINMFLIKNLFIKRKEIYSAQELASFYEIKFLLETCLYGVHIIDM